MNNCLGMFEIRHIEYVSCLSDVDQTHAIKSVIMYFNLMIFNLQSTVTTGQLLMLYLS